MSVVSLFRSDPNHVLIKLERPGAEQEVDNIPLMRLQPVELDRRQRPQVQPIDVRGICQGTLELFVLRDR